MNHTSLQLQESFKRQFEVGHGQLEDFLKGLTAEQQLVGSNMDTARDVKQRFDGSRGGWCGSSKMLKSVLDWTKGVVSWENQQLRAAGSQALGGLEESQKEGRGRTEKSIAHL